MRTFTLLPLALLATTGAALDALAWTRGLDAHNPFTGLVSRAPKGGGKGGGFGGGSSGGDDDDDDDSDDSICSTTEECPSGQKSCGEYCIPSSAECCPDDWYCPSGNRCVPSAASTYYSCCPSSDSSCDADDTSSTFAELGDFNLQCASGSGAAVVKGAWALGAAGVVVALGV